MFGLYYLYGPEDGLIEFCRRKLSCVAFEHKLFRAAGRLCLLSYFTTADLRTSDID